MNNFQKILLIEDSKDFQTIISDALPHYPVKIAESAEEGWAELLKSHYDLILLDIQLPKKNGYTLLSEIQAHASTSTIPVICITGKTAVTDKVTAFSLGADDYIQKPFDILELKARVDAKLNKAKRAKETSRVILISNLKIDLNSHLVTIALGSKAEDITLTQTEFKLLSLFSKTPGTVYSRSQILESVWGDGVSVSDRVIDVHLCALRRKIKGANLKIQPVTGQGYKLTLPSGPTLTPELT